MGFLKDVVKLSKQGSELRKTYDVGAQMAQAQQQMAAATQLLNGQAAAVSAAAADSVAGTATITALRHTGLVVNLLPMVEVDLLVHLEGRPPYPTTTSVALGVDATAKAATGRSVLVRVPTDGSSVWIDWAASPA